MTLDEFKAWFEGFVENMDGLPNEKQWGRIRKRVKEIDGAPTSYPVFVERYVRPYPVYWSSLGGYAATSFAKNNSADVVPATLASDGAAQWADAGRAEYQSIASA